MYWSDMFMYKFFRKEINCIILKGAWTFTKKKSKQNLYFIPTKYL